MSRLFSITSSTSDEMMFSAPTITIRPIVIEMRHLLEPQRREQRPVDVGPVLAT